MKIEQILEAIEKEGLDAEVEFDIDFIDDDNKECRIWIEAELDEEESLEREEPIWRISCSRTDSECYCEVVEEFKKGFIIGIAEINSLLELEEEGFDDCDHSYYDARDFEASDEANVGYYVVDESGKRVFFHLDFWRRVDNGLWQVVESYCHGDFSDSTNPAREFPVGMQVNDDVIDELDARWN